MEISVFGKLPSQADFFRHGNSGAAAREAETWFLDGYQLLRSENLDFPRTAVNVILTRPDWSEVVLAIAVASRDSVDRPFPIVAFAELDAAAVANRGWMLPVILSKFIDGAQAALYRAAAGGDADRLTGDLARLPTLNPTLMERLGDAIYLNVVHTQAVQTFESRVFDAIDERYYAYRTLRMACDQVRDEVPDQANIVLECPVSIDLDLVAWSALVAQVLGWSRTVPMIWRAEPKPRLLLSLGPLPTQALHFLVDTTVDSMRYWPLTTNSDKAIASARQALETAASWDHVNEKLYSLFERVAALTI